MPQIEVAGAAIHYRQAGDGAPLFLLHGNAGSSGVWRKVVPALAERYRVVAHDRRGFGRSDKGEPADPSPRGYARELVGLMDALGVDGAHVAGLSLGGMVAQCLALDFPRRVRGLMLLGTTADRTGRPVPETLARLARDGWPTVARRLVESWFRPNSDPADVEEAYEIALQSSQRLREVTVRALGSFDIRDEIGAIAAPTLVMVGEQDRTCPPDMSRTIAERIAGARLVSVPDCGHLIPVEQPEVCARRMLDFLAEVEAERTADAGAARP